TRHAPNRANAVKFLEFLVGEDAQKVLAEANYEYPVRAGIATAANVLGFGNFKADTLALVRVGSLNPQAVRLMDRVGWR
ncbi:MAG: Fe(3+) ABC transporter substrate-binding protein, partial [Alphaproteobacteria bacterium]